MKVLTLIDFKHATQSHNWEIVNDFVMGGISTGEFLITEDSSAVFRGKVSLENSGGFASVRVFSGEYDVSGFDGFLLMLRGDGKKYRFRVRTENDYDGVTYQMSFKTRAKEWMEIKIPLTQLQASFRGRKVSDAPPLDAGKIHRFGFLISDKQAGMFRLEIARIAVYSENGKDR